MGEQIRSREQHSRAFGSWTRDLCQRKMTGESLQLRCCRSTRQRGLGSLLSKHRPGFACLILLCRLSSADTSSAGQSIVARTEGGGDKMFGGLSSWVPVLRAAAKHTTERRHGAHPSEDATEDSSYLDLVWIGMAFGIVHVITGPDHVSAMVTLAAGKGSQAFWLGARWGAGHSLGLIIMYIALLAAGEAVFESEDAVEKIVGFIMVFLGGVGVMSAFKEHRRELAEARDVPLNELVSSDSSSHRLDGRDHPLEARDPPLSGRDQPSSARDQARDPDPKARELTAVNGEGHPTDAVRAVPDNVSLLDHMHENVAQHRMLDPSVQCSENQRNNGGLGDMVPRAGDMVPRAGDMVPRAGDMVPRAGDMVPRAGESIKACLASDGFCAKERLLSIFVGIIHGMAGPGGVLGVLPAVHQRDLRRGVVYIGAFSLATVAGMAGFAAMWGHLTGPTVVRPGSRVKFGVHLMSAALSVLVGLVWLALAFMGKLDALFGEH